MNRSFGQFAKNASDFTELTWLDQRIRLTLPTSSLQRAGSRMSFLFQIVANTPLWVWPLMAFVLWLGVQGLQPRIVPWWRLAILPLVGLGTSLSGVAQAVDPALAVAGWGAAFLAGLPLGWRIGGNRPVRRRTDGRLEIAGGSFALAFGVSIFAVRYAMGVLFGIWPVLRGDPQWIVLSAGVDGAIAGVGLGWLAAILARARREALAAG